MKMTEIALVFRLILGSDCSHILGAIALAFIFIEHLSDVWSSEINTFST